MKVIISPPLIDIYSEPINGLYVTKNIGSIDGYLIAGDGLTSATFPTVIGNNRYGFIFGTGKYLKTPILSSGTYTVIAYIKKTSQAGLDSFLLDTRSGGGTGFIYTASASPLTISNSAGTIYIDNEVTSTLKLNMPSIVACSGITLSAPAFGAIGASNALASCWLGEMYKFAIFPGTLTPLQIKSIGERWRSNLNLY